MRGGVLRAEEHPVVDRVRDGRARRLAVPQVLTRRPAAAVASAAVRGEDGEADQVAGAQAGPAVHLAHPAEGDRGLSPVGAEQSAGDGGDGVGVVADAHGVVQGVLEVLAGVGPRSRCVVGDGGLSDRGPGRLQGGDREAVGGEACSSGLVSASSIHRAHWSRRSAGSRSSPPARSRRRSTTATRTASLHNTAESPASGSAWVRAAIARAAVAVASRSSRRVRPTTTVRISAPLPALRGLRPAYARPRPRSARARRRPVAAAGGAEDRAGLDPDVRGALGAPAQEARRRWRRGPRRWSGRRRWRSPRAMHAAIWVSSLNSPGA